MGSLTKALIGKEDVDVADDELYPSTFSRITSTGSTMNLTSFPDVWKTHQDTINARSYGAKTGVGINGAVGAGTTSRSIYLEAGEWVISSSYDWSSYTTTQWIFSAGAYLTIGAGFTVTFPSPSNIIAQPNQQIFSGAGYVKFSNGGIVYPNWWTFNATPGTTDMSSALKAAWQSCDNNGAIVKLIDNCAISSQQLGLDLYQTDGSSPINNLTIMADSPDVGKITSIHADPQSAIRYNGKAAAITNLTIRNIGFIGNSQYTAATFTYGTAITLRKASNVRIEGCVFQNWPVAAVQFGSYATTASDEFYFKGNKVYCTGALLGASGILVYFCNDVCEVTNNYFDQIARAIDLEITSAAYALGDLTVSENTILNGDVSSISATHTYSGIHILRDYENTVVGSINIIGNILAGSNDSTAGTSDINLTGYSDGVAGGNEIKVPLIANNIIRDSDAANHILLFDIESPMITNNVIYGKDAGANGIYFYSCKNALVSLNHFYGTLRYDIAQSSAAFYRSTGARIFLNKPAETTTGNAYNYTNNTGTMAMQFLSASVIWDPADIADGAVTNVDVTVTGAAAGDTAVASHSKLTVAKAYTMAQVTAANTVTVTLVNHTGGNLNVASGTLRVDVWKH
jgi:hypothetical protein